MFYLSDMSANEEQRSALEEQLKAAINPKPQTVNLPVDTTPACRRGSTSRKSVSGHDIPF